MALIPRYHTAVAQFTVDPADVNTDAIYQGMMVGINSSGYVKKASNSQLPIGIAGDSLAVTAGHNAYQASLVVNPGGATKSTQNRVSDYFNETLGSGLMSVYITGGEFYTDMYVVGTSFTVGTAIKASNASPGYIDGAGSTTVGVLTSGIKQYPNGVPGVDGGANLDYSMQLNSISGGGFIGFVMQL